MADLVAVVPPGPPAVTGKERRALASAERHGKLEARQEVRRDLAASRKEESAAAKARRSALLGEVRSMSPVAERAVLLGGTKTTGQLRVDSQRLAIVVGTFRPTRLHEVARWDDVTGVDVTGNEAQTVSTAVKGKNREAFHVLSAIHQKGSATTSVPTSSHVSVHTRSRGELVVAVPAGPAAVRAALASFVHALTSREVAPEQAVPQPGGPSLADALRELAQLRDEGLLTDEEKAALLESRRQRNEPGGGRNTE